MRLIAPLVLVPALAAAQEQYPFAEQVQGWIEKAKGFLPTAVTAEPSAAPVAASPSSAAAAAAAASSAIPHKDVTTLTIDNWQSTLAPLDAESDKSSQEWFIYITGGNKTCFGRCGQADEAFEKSVDLFAVDSTSPALARVNCEKENILCSIWSVGPPSLWRVEVPVQEAGQPKPLTPIHSIPLNATTITAEEMYKIHSEKTWEKTEEYKGAFHPMDGWLAEYNLNIPLGYAIYGISVVPSWMMMIGVSFFSRTIMSRRMGNAGRAPAPAAGGQQAPAAQ